MQGIDRFRLVNVVSPSHALGGSALRYWSTLQPLSKLSLRSVCVYGIVLGALTGNEEEVVPMQCAVGTACSASQDICLRTLQDSRMTLYKMKVAGLLFSLIEAYPANTIVHQLVASSMEASVSPQRKSGLKAWLKEFSMLRRILDAWEEEGDRFFQDALVPTYLSIYVQMALYVKKVLECPGVDVNKLLGDELENDFRKFCVEVLAKVVEMRAKPEGTPDYLQNPRADASFKRTSTAPLFRVSAPASSEVASICEVPGNEEEPQKVESTGEANPLALHVQETLTVNGKVGPVTLWPPKVDSLDMAMLARPDGTFARPAKGPSRSPAALPGGVVPRDARRVDSNDLISSMSKTNT